MQPQPVPLAGDPGFDQVRRYRVKYVCGQGAVLTGFVLFVAQRRRWNRRTG